MVKVSDIRNIDHKTLFFHTPTSHVLPPAFSSLDVASLFSGYLSWEREHPPSLLLLLLGGKGSYKSVPLFRSE